MGVCQTLLVDHLAKTATSRDCALLPCSMDRVTRKNKDRLYANLLGKSAMINTRQLLDGPACCVGKLNLELLKRYAILNVPICLGDICIHQNYHHRCAEKVVIPWGSRYSKMGMSASMRLTCLEMIESAHRSINVVSCALWNLEGLIRGGLLPILQACWRLRFRSPVVDWTLAIADWPVLRHDETSHSQAGQIDDQIATGLQKIA